MTATLTNGIEVTRFGQEKVQMDAEGPDQGCFCACSCMTYDVKVSNNQFNGVSNSVAMPQP